MKVEEEVAESIEWGREVGAGFVGCQASWFYEVFFLMFE